VQKEDQANDRFMELIYAMNDLQMVLLHIHQPKYAGQASSSSPQSEQELKSCALLPSGH